MAASNLEEEEETRSVQPKLRSVRNLKSTSANVNMQAMQYNLQITRDQNPDPECIAENGADPTPSQQEEPTSKSKSNPPSKSHSGTVRGSNQPAVIRGKDDTILKKKAGVSDHGKSSLNEDYQCTVCDIDVDDSSLPLA